MDKKYICLKCNTPYIIDENVVDKNIFCMVNSEKKQICKGELQEVVEWL